MSYSTPEIVWDCVFNEELKQLIFPSVLVLVRSSTGDAFVEINLFKKGGILGRNPQEQTKVLEFDSLSPISLITANLIN